MSEQLPRAVPGNRFAGSVALITGAARGMGADQAAAMVAEGGRVMIADIAAEEGQQLAATLGPNAEFVHLDVTAEQDWIAAVARTREVFGPPNVLVNNAGIVRPSGLDEGDAADFRTHLEINLVGAFLGIRHTAAVLGEAGAGAIVNVSSIAGMSAFPGFAGYSASKWGLRGLTRTAAIELGRQGIRVNSVHPGFVATSMSAEIPYLPEMVRYQPIPRIGTPADVTPVVLFLASPEAGYITGSEYVVDGGAMAPLAALGTLAALSAFTEDNETNDVPMGSP